MKPGTLLRLAFAGGRTDTLRVILTAASVALGVLALLAAATVAAIPELAPTGDNPLGLTDRYGNGLLREPGLRPGVIVALLLVAVPVLALAGQSIRFGSPARDRRLAALRLAGATPRQTVLVAAAETVLAAGGGALLGLACYFAGRPLLHRPNAGGRLPLPTDVLPPAWATVAIVLAAPVVAALVGAFLLRKVIVTPLGVIRRTRRSRPGVWPGLLMLGGVLVPLSVWPVAGWFTGFADLRNNTIGAAVIVVALVLAVLGVVAGTAWIAASTGWLLHRFSRRPAMLLAGRQLMADPWNGSRTLAALLGAVVVGAGTLHGRSTLFTTMAAEREYARRYNSAGQVTYPDYFYVRSVELVNTAVAVVIALAAAGMLVALAEGIVSRRRGYAALVATGVPRRTLGEAVAWQTLAPLVPALAVALSVGLSLVRATGSTVTSGESGRSYCNGTPAQCDKSTAWTFVSDGPPVRLPVPVPVADLLLLGGGAFAAMLAVVGVAVLLLRMSTDIEELRAA